MTLPAWFDHLQGSFSHKKVHLKSFYLPVKFTSGLPAENINKGMLQVDCVFVKSFRKLELMPFTQAMDSFQKEPTLLKLVSRMALFSLVHPPELLK